MLDDPLLISELAERAGVSVRTIRFYINEGLLPPPEARGRYSVYDEEYLTRIELIKRLKSAYLPLKEIKRMVESLSKEETESMLHTLSEPLPATPPASPQPPASPGMPSPSSKRASAHHAGDPSGHSRAIKESGLPEALNYITRVLQSQAAPAIHTTPPPPIPVRTSPVQQDAGAGFAQPEESESSWRRYTIQPGVELLVSEQVYTQSAPSIHRIVAQVKQLFSSHPTGGKNV